MKKLSITLIILCASFFGHSQNVVKDATGNYVAVKVSKDTSNSNKPTGKTYTDSKGNVYPVFVSKNDKLFVIRTSKNGNQYKQYLKL